MTAVLGLQKSTDFGQTWNRDTERFFGSATIIWSMDAVGAGDTLALGTNFGPYLTFDGGESVFRLDNGYPPSDPADEIRVISVDPLEIWTRARRHGIWSYTCSDSTGSVTEGEWSVRRGNGLSLHAHPNPTRGTLQVVLSSMPAKPPDLCAYNVLGQRISVETFKTVNGWRVQFPTDLSAGVYFLACRVPSGQAGGHPMVYRVVLER